MFGTYADIVLVKTIILWAKVSFASCDIFLVNGNLAGPNSMPFSWEITGTLPCDDALIFWIR
jgi:hypothetical protein